MRPGLPSVDRWSAAAALAAAAAGVLVALRGIHTDDLEVIGHVSELDYGDLLTEPFRDRYYRPLTSAIAKLGHDTIGANLLLRLIGAFLVAANTWVFSRITRDLVGPARLAGALCLVGAPFTFVAIAPFGVGIGDSIVGLALLAAIASSISDGPGDLRAWPLVAATLVALAAKESGLVVGAYAGAEALRRRRWPLLAATVAIAAGYVVAHAAMVEGRPYILRTGWFFDMLSVAEQRQRFGDRPLPLQLYTAAANFVSTLAYVPYQGQLRMSPSIAAFAAVAAGTTAVIGRWLASSRAWRRVWPLLVVVPANAALGFAYARPRIMFAAYLVVAVLLARALDRRWQNGARREVSAALAVYVAVLASTLARLATMP